MQIKINNEIRSTADIVVVASTIAHLMMEIAEPLHFTVAILVMLCKNTSR